MSPIAISLDETTEFVLKSEQNEDGTPKPGATVFTIGVMDQIKFASLSSMAFRIENDDAAYERYLREALKRGLRGWRNFNDAAGNAVEFKTDKDGFPTDKTLSVLPTGCAALIAAEIVRFNAVSGKELGN